VAACCILNKRIAACCTVLQRDNVFICSDIRVCVCDVRDTSVQVEWCIADELRQESSCVTQM